jgi:hypothetical protein
LIRWWPRAIKLIEFVKTPSPTFADTYLYAMRYEVTVLSEKEVLATYSTDCAAVVTFKEATYSEPTVVCDPVNIDQTVGTS